MNVLFVVPYAPTPIRTRPYNLLRGLARGGHNVTLATLWENEQERQALEELDNEGIRVISVRLAKIRSAWNCLRALPTATPLQAVYCWQPKLMDNIQSAVDSRQYDIIHVEHLRGARYGLRITQSPNHPPVVWDSVDCISHLFEQASRNSRSPFGRIVTRLELGRTRRYEGWLVNQFDHVLVTSSVDAAALSALPPRLTSHSSRPIDLQSAIINHKSEISILPNGVDLDYFASTDAPREPETIVFSGKMSYHANVTAAIDLVNDIMPRVWQVRPNARVQIVGKDPPREIRELAMRHTPFATCTGTVPDIRPFLRGATVAVAPIAYGAGIQNKVLEAMACGTPVVATTQAVSALHVRDGEQLLIGNGAEAFARQVLRLLEDGDLRRRIGQAGRCYVEKNHDWDGIVSRLVETYAEVVGRRQHA
jgi:polysaccharide biosynthesis protein PslH